MSHKAAIRSSEPFELKYIQLYRSRNTPSGIMEKIHSENVEIWHCIIPNRFHENIWTIVLWTGSTLSTLRLHSGQLHTHLVGNRWCNQLTLKIAFTSLRFFSILFYFIDHNPHWKAIHKNMQRNREIRAKCTILQIKESCYVSQCCYSIAWIILI